jgi:hypothetical protein
MATQARRIRQNGQASVTDSADGQVVESPAADSVHAELADLRLRYDSLARRMLALEAQMVTATAEHITITQAAARFGVSRDRLRMWVDRRILTVKGRDESDGRGPVLLDLGEVQSVVERLGVEPRLGRPPKS